MAINYANENIGKKCGVCGKGIVYYYREVNKAGEIELIGCSNPDCKGHIAPGD